jgi:mannitol/fructose-specific phosphotransferase system IIA component (Ntr-type)
VKLSDLLQESAVLLDLDGRTKWEAIEVLTDRLVGTSQVPAEHRDTVHAALVARERSMSTGMEQGIAIPHTSVDQVLSTAVALGVARSGIDFQSIDGRPTQLVILLVNPANQTKAHIRTLAEIARLLSSAELRAGLVQAPSPRDVLATIRAAEAAVA